MGVASTLDYNAWRKRPFERALAANRISAFLLLLDTPRKRLAHLWIGCIMLPGRRNMMWPERPLSISLLVMALSDIISRLK